MGDISFDDGGFDGVEGLEGLADFLNVIGDTAAAPDEPVQVALLDGDLVKGPFKDTDAQGYPLVEVWEVELGAGGGARPQRLGMVGLMPHDAGPSDVLATHGPGIWVCTVRGASGKILRQRFVATGSTDQRRAKATRRQKPVEQRNQAESDDSAPAWLRSLLAQQAEAAAEQRKRQEEEARATREELTRMRRESEERREAESRALKAELERLRQAPARPAPSSPSEHVQALRGWLDQGAEVRDALAAFAPTAPAVEEQPQKGFMEEVAGELGQLLKNAGDLKDLLSLVK